jgi:hypothetical protein
MEGLHGSHLCQRDYNEAEPDKCPHVRPKETSKTTVLQTLRIRSEICQYREQLCDCVISISTYMRINSQVA